MFSTRFLYRPLASLLLFLYFLWDSVDCQQVPYEDYRCGSGAISTSISYTSSFLCDQIQLNQCCMEHDMCYASCLMPQMACDNEFCACLSLIISNPICQAIVFPTHCNFARLFGNLFICPMMGK